MAVHRAPEVILGHTYDGRIDIWSVGAVLAELFTNYVLFQNDSVASMLSRIIGILGPFPAHILSNCADAGKYFTASNLVYEREEQDPNTFHLIFPKKTSLRSRLHCESKGSSDEDLFVDFIRALLDLDCMARLTAAEALQHPWLADADTVQFTEYIIGQPHRDAADITGNAYEHGEDYEEDDSDDYDDEEEEGEYEEDLLPDSHFADFRFQMDSVSISISDDDSNNEEDEEDAAPIAGIEEDQRNAIDLPSEHGPSGSEEGSAIASDQLHSTADDCGPC
jgi:serine/threonine protein kinase